MSPIDIFGGQRGGGGAGIRGPRGPKGAQGKDGPSGLKVASTWLGNSLLDQYRVSEEHLCLLIENVSLDLVREGLDGSVMQWISRCKVRGTTDTKKAAKSLKNPSKNIVPLTTGGKYRQQRGRYALDFLNDNVYLCENINFFPALPTPPSSSSSSSSSCIYLNLCVTFRTNGGHAKQTIISSSHREKEVEEEDGGMVVEEPGEAKELKYFREISADATSIYIEDCCGAESVLTSIQYDTRRWCTLLVEWFHIAPTTTTPTMVGGGGNNGVGRYTLVDDDMKETTGDFKLTLPPPKDRQRLGITLGGRGDGTSEPFSGLIASIEIYLSLNDGMKKDLLPEEMKSLLIRDCHVVNTITTTTTTSMD